MDRSRVHVQIAHPNLAKTSDETLDRAYDVVIAKTEKFVTPRGVKGKATVFSRVSPNRIKTDKTGQLQEAAANAKSLITDAISKLRLAPEKKKGLLGHMTAFIKGNIDETSKEFFSADSARLIRPALRLSDNKLVRFADEAPAEIKASRPRAASAPTEVVLPELPPET